MSRESFYCIELNKPYAAYLSNIFCFLNLYDYVNQRRKSKLFQFYLKITHIPNFIPVVAWTLQRSPHSEVDLRQTVGVGLYYCPDEVLWLEQSVMSGCDCQAGFMLIKQPDKGKDFY